MLLSLIIPYVKVIIEKTRVVDCFRSHRGYSLNVIWKQTKNHLLIFLFMRQNRPNNFFVNLLRGHSYRYKLKKTLPFRDHEVDYVIHFIYNVTCIQITSS